MQKTKRFIKAVLELALFAALGLGMVLLFRLVSAGTGQTPTGGLEGVSTVYPPPESATPLPYPILWRNSDDHF